jgi:hypothetical protein
VSHLQLLGLLLIVKGLLSLLLLLLVLLMIGLLQGLMPGGGISWMVVISLTMDFSSATRGRWGKLFLPWHHLVMSLHRPLG